jgi:hypothetical protein
VGRRIRALAQKYDSFHHVVIINHYAIRAMNGFPYLAQANFGTLCNRGDVFDPQCGPILRFQHRPPA